MIYLDEAATSPVRREVLEAMWPWLTRDFGNAASHHGVGETARVGLADARARVARVLGGRPGEVVLTSGGTEADNLAVKGIALAEPRDRHVLVSAVEHQAVLESSAFLTRLGFEVEQVPVDADGRVTPDALRALLRPGTTLVSIQLANNEVGTVQPVAELAGVAAEHGVPFHTDAVQAVGVLPVDVGALGVHALSLSGHKLGTPTGVGALWLHRRQAVEPLVHGGGQQRGLRSGTDDVAGAVGLATALELARATMTGALGRAGDTAALAARRDAFVARVLTGVPRARLTGHPTERLPGHASFVLPGLSGESVLVDLEARGVVCSSGSACAAGSDEPSHVLTAMGVDAETAQTAVRFSFGAATTTEQLDRAAEELVAVAG